MFQRIGVLIIKELLAVWRDPKSRVILIVPPMMQMLIFSMAATQEVKNTQLGVRDLDHGEYARDLIARFEGSPNFSEVVSLPSDAAIARALDAGEVLIVLHISPEFSRDLAAGRSTQVQLLLDGRRSNTAQIAASYAIAIVATYNEDLNRQRQARPAASVLVARSWFNPNLQATWHTVPALVAILSTLMGLMVTALAVARERELGTFEQLLVSPLSPAEIIVGKTVPALLIGMGEATGMALVAVFIFRIPFHGSIGLFYLSLVVYLASVIGVGLFISSLARTQQQAILGAFVFMVPSILLSGFASPIENMPIWLQWCTMLNPARHFMVIIKGIFLKDMPVSEVLKSLWPLSLIAVGTLLASAWLFRRRMD
jgi:ABC-2 type transport system permease protein